MSMAAAAIFFQLARDDGRSAQAPRRLEPDDGH
jgi:hypothetical protein